MGLPTSLWAEHTNMSILKLSEKVLILNRLKIIAYQINKILLMPKMLSKGRSRERKSKFRRVCKDLIWKVDKLKKILWQRKFSEL